MRCGVNSGCSSFGISWGLLPLCLVCLRIELIQLKKIKRTRRRRSCKPNGGFWCCLHRAVSRKPRAAPPLAARLFMLLFLQNFKSFPLPRLSFPLLAIKDSSVRSSFPAPSHACAWGPPPWSRAERTLRQPLYDSYRDVVLNAMRPRFPCLAVGQTYSGAFVGFSGA